MVLIMTMVEVRAGGNASKSVHASAAGVRTAGGGGIGREHVTKFRRL